MGEQQEITIGELYRLCERIETKVDKTNGRVDKLEDDVLRIKTLWSAGIFGGAAVWPYVKGKFGL